MGQNVRYYIARDKFARTSLTTQKHVKKPQNDLKVVSEDEMREKYDDNVPPVRVV